MNLAQYQDPDVIRQTLKTTPEQEEQLREMLQQNVEFRIPFQVLPLQDCVDLAIFLVRATMVAQSLAVAVRGVGGMIEVATITRTEGLTPIQRRTIRGENERTFI